MDTSARRRAAAVAGHTGDVDGARSHLADPAPAVRATALGALARLGALELDDLRDACGDTDAGVRRRAAAVLATGPSCAAGSAGDDLVLALLLDPADEVVETACFCAGERPVAPAVVARVADLATGHTDALVREAAVAALGALGDPAGLPAVLAGTRDRPAVRRRAVLALAPFDGPEVDEALRRALDDRDWQVRQAAEDLLDTDDDHDGRG